MARIIMTGMCSVQDRLAYHSDLTRVFFRPFYPVVRSYDDVVGQFKKAANTGNYLITEGAYRAFDGHSVDYIPFWYLQKVIKEQTFREWVKNEYKFCLFATANILNADFDLTAEVDVLESLPMPTIFMSIGVQRRSDLAGALHPGAARFVEFLKRDTSHAFTRGAFAAQFLRSQGVKNVYEACCPSAFNFSDQIIQGVKRLKELDLGSLGEIWINGYLGAHTGASIPEIKTFLPIAKRLGYVFQDEPLLFGAMSNMIGESRIYDDGTGRVTRKPRCHPEQFDHNSIDYYAFFSPEQWRSRSGAVDLVVGTRFHGNLVALQAGRPAFFIAHDDRVMEMLSSIGLPYVHPVQWNEAPDRIKFFETFVRSINLSKFENVYNSKKETFEMQLSEIV